MNLEHNEFANYYSPSGVLLEKTVPRVLLLPSQEESVIPVYANPQHHTREGMRGSWLTTCSNCDKPLTTTIDLIKPRQGELIDPERRYYKNSKTTPMCQFNVKIIKSARKKIVCTDCGTNPKERFDDDVYLVYLDKLVKVKNKRRIKKFAILNENYKTEYHFKHREKILLKMKAYRKKNKKMISEKKKKYDLAHREKNRAYLQAWRLKTKD